MALKTPTPGREAHCNASCDGYAPYCGDQIVSDGEACDAGAGNNDGYSFAGVCNTSCSALGPRCGDDEVQSEFETCDDGDANTNVYSASEVCNNTCQGFAPRCGDGQVQFDEGETCDDGDANQDVYAGQEVICDTTCKGHAPYCRNNREVTDGEECDTGDNNNDVYGIGETCNRTCCGLFALIAETVSKMATKPVMTVMPMPTPTVFFRIAMPIVLTPRRIAETVSGRRRAKPATMATATTAITAKAIAKRCSRFVVMGLSKVMRSATTATPKTVIIVPPIVVRR